MKSQCTLLKMGGISSNPKTRLKNLSDLPDAPGVYFFIGCVMRRKKILYIGKATSLKDRVRSYFGKDTLSLRGPAIARMLQEAIEIKWAKTDSVLEALLLEAELIKKHQPTYNSMGKDDKSYNYVVITDEEFPRILLIRKNILNRIEGHNPDHDKNKIRYTAEEKSLKTKSCKLKAVYGPFPNGGELKEALRIIRKIFPFRDKCMPCNIKNKEEGGCKPCFNAQIGLCPGICNGTISKKEYAQTIRHLKFFFYGRKKQLLRQLEREMINYSKKEKFEKAAIIRKKLFSLKHIQDVALLKNSTALSQLRLQSSFAEATDDKSSGNTDSMFRIESYDVAHLSGGATVGAMVVVESGDIKKSDYRRFRIRSAPAGSDTDALKEMFARRLSHREWPLPDLIVVDGGAAQKNAAERTLRKYFDQNPSLNVTYPQVVGVVKNEHHKPQRLIGDQRLALAHEKEILLANSEAHRFAVTYHRKIRDHASL